MTRIPLHITATVPPGGGSAKIPRHLDPLTTVRAVHNYEVGARPGRRHHPGGGPVRAVTGLAAALLAVAVLATTGTAVAQAPDEVVVRWTAHVDAAATVTAGRSMEVVLRSRIDRGWNLYALTQEGDGPQPLTIRLAPGSPFRVHGALIGPLPFSAWDPNFDMETQYHIEAATFYVPVMVPAEARGRIPLDLDVTHQSCTARFCLPPATDRVSLSLLVPGTGADAQAIVSEVTAAARPAVRVEDMAAAIHAGTPPEITATEGRAASETAVSAAPAAGTAPEITATAAPALPLVDMGATTSAATLLAYLALAALMGALSLLTPCVFPMVPITVSYFTSHAGSGRGRAVSHALVYGGGIVLTFSALGLVLALVAGAGGLNQLAASPWLNLGIAALFVVFALNLFGVFELRLPSRFLTRAAMVDDENGRYSATLLMGLVFTLTSFTCTAPFLGTLMVVASQGAWQWPLAGMLVFSTVLALPFVVLAWAPQAVAALPRSGPWLLSIKVCMGLIVLAAALNFLSNVDLVLGAGIFTRDVVIAAWVVIGGVMVAYLAGLLRIGHAPRLSRPGGVRAVGAAAALAITLWLTSGLAGNRLGELEAFLPPSELGGHDGELAWVVNDYEGALALAAAANQPVLLDFTGYTCTNCRWMEANMFTHPDVSREMARYVRVRLYTDGRGEPYREQQNLQRDVFGTVALPYYAVLSPAGTPILAFGGLTRDTQHFVAFLQRGLE
jgi:thiol:disulfide interchange protein